jgi:hypothetical protein
MDQIILNSLIFSIFYLNIHVFELVFTFNLTCNRPCINLTQIEDGKTDCLSGLDERNRSQCAGWGMLGFHFQFNDSLCGIYSDLCTNYYPWKRSNNVAYDSMCFHQQKFFKNGTQIDCNSVNDVMCLNGTCIKNAKCNGKNECLHSEDEYRCITRNKPTLSYRGDKKKNQIVEITLRIYPLPTQSLHTKSSSHPNDRDHHLVHVVDERHKQKSVNHVATVYEKRNFTITSVYEIVRNIIQVPELYLNNIIYYLSVTVV